MSRPWKTATILGAIVVAVAVAAAVVFVAVALLHANTTGR
jgi:multisubunit Na+/H+ antiporter MnhC subunit